MRTTLFEWAEEQGLSLSELGDKLGYSERHLRRIREGEYPLNDAFVAQVVFRLGEWARALFLSSVSENTDII